MKTILVPTDFTPYSNNALRLATYMAKAKGMAIKILHIIEEPALTIGSKIPFFKKENYQVDLEAHEQSIKDHLNRLVALEKTNEVNVEYEVRRSKAGISREVLKEDCDVIIMGRKREDNYEVDWTGTVADKILRLSSVPVITVGELPEGFQLKKIVFAADFEDETIRPIFQRVIDLANIFKAELHFLYVIINREYRNETDAEKRIKGIIDKFDFGNKELEVYYSPAEEDGITDYIEETKPDLLAMCTKGKTGLAHFFLGSVAENMSQYATIPVLTYNVNPKKIDRSARPITREKIIWSTRSWKKV